MAFSHGPPAIALQVANNISFNKTKQYEKINAAMRGGIAMPLPFIQNNQNIRPEGEHYDSTMGGVR